jgi:hypothetical protein
MNKRIRNRYQSKNDHILTTPIPKLIYNDPIIQSFINKKIDALYNKYPVLKNKLCKDDHQKRKALIIIFISLFILYGIIEKEWNPIAVFASIPFIAYTDFINELSQSNNPILAYFFYLILIIGLSTLVFYIIQCFITGKLEDKFLTINGLLKWLINIYLIAITSLILKPLVVWYAYHYTKLNGYFTSPVGIFSLVTVFICMMFIPESVENIGSIYFSVPCFYLFIKLNLHYLFTFIFLGINQLFHIEIFKNINILLSFVLVALMQLLIEYIKKLKIYDYFIKVIQFFFTTILGIISLPFIFLICIIMIIVF